tara:strand:- start:122 stop:973 length:852 start_codon:yes stop_codon:yes gene_type:complete
MSIKYSNNAATTVATSFSNSATALVVADASEFPTLTGSDELRITLSDVTNTVFEIVTCTAIAGTTLTVVRAQENTTAAAWAIGTDVSLRITAAGLEAKADKTQVLTNVPAGALFTDTNTVYSLPTQASNANKFLKTDGSNESWAVVEALPSQSGNTGKFLTTDGSAATWATQAVNGTAERTVFTATAGQTSFAVTYTSGFVDVYLNGIKLQIAIDFTGTSGSAVVLAVGASVGDIVDVVAYGTFTLANHYTKTQTDNLIRFEIDGGVSNSTYLATQLVDGGTA